MAGSYVSIKADVPDDLYQRLEGLKFLAEHVNEPIAILNAQMKVVYANPLADKLIKDCPFIPSHFLASSISEDVQPSHCTSCHVVSVFRPHEKVDIAFSNESTWTCPLPRAVPIYNESGDPYFAVLMSAPPSANTCTRRPLGLLQESPDSLLSPKSISDDDPQHHIIGGSEPMLQLLRMIHLVADSEATVLIQGESGTGKELVAKTIHALSGRRKNPFVVVECSSLPETLLESELFGHVQGAFTGAVVERKGLFEEAEGGTIFLDEIADTTPAFQARLLRVLQEGEIKPVGSNQSIKVNVRVISAGNKPLEKLVQAKQFRADLYYRLAVLPLMVPALCERPEDIPQLAKHFLKRSVQQHGRRGLTFHADVLPALSSYSWPGNVRELENLIERAVVTAQHPMIHVADIFGKKKTPTRHPDLHSVSKAARQTAERDRILQALSETKGDKTRAARLLRISRSGLYNKLRMFNLS